jgi:hypothetical protein
MKNTIDKNNIILEQKNLKICSKNYQKSSIEKKRLGGKKIIELWDNNKTVDLIQPQIILLNVNG